MSEHVSPISQETVPTVEAQPQSRLLFREVKHDGECEDCGFYTDSNLVVALNDAEIGSYWTDGHLGEVYIDQAVVEATVVKALNIPEADYAAFGEERDSLRAEFDVLGQKTYDTEEETQAGYEAYLALEEKIDYSFDDFLRSRGVQVTRERTHEDDGEIEYDTFSEDY